MYQTLSDKQHICFSGRSTRTSQPYSCTFLCACTLACQPIKYAVDTPQGFWVTFSQRAILWPAVFSFKGKSINQSMQQAFSLEDILAFVIGVDLFQLTSCNNCLLGVVNFSDFKTLFISSLNSVSNWLIYGCNSSVMIGLSKMTVYSNWLI